MLALLLLARLLLAAGLPLRAAQADACATCAAPTEASLSGQPGYALYVREDRWGTRRSDTLHVDGDACTYALGTTPVARLGKSWMVLRGTGTVCNCPWGATDASVSVSLGDGDSTDWKVEGEVQAEVALVALKASAGLKVGVTHGRSLHEVREVTQRIEAAPGHVLDWEGWFELAELTLDLELDVTRRYAWWTKNQLTGDEVHLRGEVLVGCGRERVTLRRQASIGVRFRLWDAPCDGSAAPTDLGTFPRPRPAPALTPSPAAVPVLPVPVVPAPVVPANLHDPVEPAPVAPLLDEPLLHREPGVRLPWEEDEPAEPIPGPLPAGSGALPPPPTGALPPLPALLPPLAPVPPADPVPPAGPVPPAAPAPAEPSTTQVLR
ncbi:MAG: hypothetical protein ACKOSS_07490 [Planctomycetia bacterium]